MGKTTKIGNMADPSNAVDSHADTVLPEKDDKGRKDTPSEIPRLLGSRQVADDAFKQATDGTLKLAKSKGVNLRRLAEKVAKAAEDSKPDTSRLDEHLGKMQQQLREMGRGHLESSERTIQEMLRMQENEARSRSREVERAIEKAFREKENRERSERELEGFARRAGFTSISTTGGPLSPNNRKSWIHRIPVWKDFGHWFRYASLFAGATTTATGLGQYAVALAFLTLCLVCCIAQIYVWQTNRHRLTKFFLAVLSIALIACGFAVILDQKGNKRWGVFFRQPVNAEIENLNKRYEAQQVKDEQTKRETADIEARVRQREAEIEQSQIAVEQSQQNRKAEIKRIEGAKTIDEVLNTKAQGSPLPTPSSNAPLSALAGIPFKGGTPQRLDVLMKAAGYGGPTAMAVLIVGNDDNNVNEVWVGTDPKVTEKYSWRLDGGSYFNFPGGEDTARVYVRSVKDGTIYVTYRPH
jgi:hypothetical protein